MIKLFLNTTDNFLCKSIRNSFTKAEESFKQRNLQINLKQELVNFQENPLGCVIGLDSNFEQNIKMKIKLNLGLFFVFIPLVGFSIFSLLVGIPITYGVVATFVVAILVSSRFEELSRLYVQTRSLELQR